LLLALLLDSWLVLLLFLQSLGFLSCHLLLLSRHIRLVLLILVALLDGHLEGQKRRSQAFLCFQHFLLELNQGLHVNEPGDVERGVEEAGVDDSLEDVRDLEIAQVVHEGERVHHLDDDVLILVDLFWHT